MADFFDRFRLDGRAAIVTGTSSGLGVTFARALAEAGAVVVLAARRLDRVEELAEAMRAEGHTVAAVRADIADEHDCQQLVAAAMERFGRLDVLVNNAGVGAMRSCVRRLSRRRRRRARHPRRDQAVTSRAGARRAGGPWTSCTPWP